MKLPYPDNVDGLMQERRNSIANALELRLSCSNPSMWIPSLARWQFYFGIDSSIQSNCNSYTTLTHWAIEAKWHIYASVN